MISTQKSAELSKKYGGNNAHLDLVLGFDTSIVTWAKETEHAY